MSGTKSTDKELVSELQKRNEAGRYDKIIDRARNKGYHCFKFDQIPEHPEYGEGMEPKTQLVYDLREFPELADIRDDVMNGIYDEAPDEADDEMLRGWLREDGEDGERMIDILGLNKKSK